MSDSNYANINDPYEHPFIMEGLLTLEECKNIIKSSQDKLHDSKMVEGLNKERRNSKQCWIPKSSPLVNKLYNQISKYFGIPLENAEDFQVVRYLPGEYFKEHHDACCENNLECKNFLNEGGQRILTILIYLNEEFNDGHTYFPNLGLKIKAKPGNAIVFHPTAKNSNKCHPLALHAGLPVTKGIKWIANIWFRERKHITSSTDD